MSRLPVLIAVFAIAVGPAALAESPSSPSAPPPSIQTPSARALFGTASEHFNGTNGRPQNRTEAVRLYRQAAEAGHPAAMFILGASYSNG